MIPDDQYGKLSGSKSLEILLDDNIISFRNDYGPKTRDYEHQEKRGMTHLAEENLTSIEG